jgi:hypothetical protein
MGMAALALDGAAFGWPRLRARDPENTGEGFDIVEFSAHARQVLIAELRPTSEVANDVSKLSNL